MDAFALTDHGNLYGAVTFYDRMKAEGMHPIIGCEVYVAPRRLTDRSDDQDKLNRHLILLAENLKGYKNLIKLSTISWTQGYYYRPRIDFEVLSEHKEGLIALSACLQGVVNQPFLNESEESARRELERYAKLFGEDNFYLELQNHGLEDEAKVRAFLIDMARELGLPLVATNDCHYAYFEDATAHDIALCLQTRVKETDADRLKFPSPDYFIKSAGEMIELFKDVPEAVENTLRIAKRCNIEITSNKVFFPVFTVPEEDKEEAGLSHDEILRKKAYEGARVRFGENLPEEVEKRLEEELAVIASTGFSTLFLIVWDLMRYAREKGIPVGPGRGSAAGSLVAYCLFITNIDPLKHGLFFERFLNKERVELPDFDLDFCYERRDEMIEYVRRRYGEECVAQIITFSTLKPRAAVKAVGRVRNLEFAYVDRITKKISGLNVHLKDAMVSNRELAEVISQDPVARQLIVDASKLEGMSSHVSVHAAGVVIADKPLTEYVPLRKVKDSEMLVTQYDMDSLAKVGLLKFDFLGLKTLTVIDKCLRYLEEIEGIKIDINAIPFDDQEVYENIYTKGNTFGVFQFEAAHIIRIMKETAPSSLEDLTALNALNRPGPMKSGMVELYVRNSKEPQKAKSSIPELERILKPTGGVLLYQEQVMAIARELAGYSLGEADLLRKAMGKKIPALMRKQRDEFIRRATERGIKKRKAQEIWDMMESFAGYGFNKAHSACYAYLSYQTAYLKYYYPHYFMSAFMNCYINEPEDIAGAISDCRRMGVSVIPPSINVSKYEFTPTKDRKIIFGLGGIKHVGRSAVDEIERARRIKGKFSSFNEFLESVDSSSVNRTALEFLIKAGAFDEFGVDRKFLLNDLDRLLSRRGFSSQIGIFAESSEEASTPRSGSTTEDIAAMERESLGLYLTHNPFEDAAVLKDSSVVQIGEILARLEQTGMYLEGAKVSVGGVLDAVSIRLSRKGQKYATAKLCSEKSSISLVVGPSVFGRVQPLLRDGNEVVVTGTLNLDDAVEEDFEELARALKIYTEKMDLYSPLRAEARKAQAIARISSAQDFKVASDSGIAEIVIKPRKPLIKTELSRLRSALNEASGDVPVCLLLGGGSEPPRKLYLGGNCHAKASLLAMNLSKLGIDAEIIFRREYPSSPEV